MTTPIMPEQDPLEELKRMRAQQANGERDPLEELRAMRGVGRAQHPAEEEPSFASKALGTAASLVRDIPGAEALQAAAAAGASHIPGWSDSGPLSYREARQMIRDVEGSAPKAATIPSRIAGGTVAALASPTSLAGKVLTPAMQGAGFGVLSGALQSDLDAGLGERARDAAIGGVTGAAAGKAGELVTNWIRAGVSPTAGNQALQKADEIKAIDRKNFGRAELEGVTGGGTSPEIQAALQHPVIRSLADDIRASNRLQGNPNSDADVLMQLHRELSQNEGALLDRINNASTSRPLTQREQGDVQAVKRMLRDAAESLMPSYRGANQTHAQLKGEEGAMQQGVDATKRLLGNTRPTGRNLTKKSDEAFFRDIASMSAPQAQAARGGVLGQAKDYIGLDVDPTITTGFGLTKGFGLLPSLGRAGQISPALRALDQQAGGAPKWVDLMRAIANAEGHPTP